jgi:hypothetical protein
MISLQGNDRRVPRTSSSRRHSVDGADCAGATLTTLESDYAVRANVIRQLHERGDSGMWSPLASLGDEPLPRLRVIEELRGTLLPEELLGGAGSTCSSSVVLSEPLFHGIEAEVEPLTSDQPVPFGVHDLPATLVVERPDPCPVPVQLVALLPGETTYSLLIPICVHFLCPLRSRSRTRHSVTTNRRGRMFRGIGEVAKGRNGIRDLHIYLRLYCA